MSTDNGLLSVIVPIYNAELYLKQCLDSIINQQYKELEIILVDDGSTDHSGDIADAYRRDTRVRVIHKKNEGPFKARWEGAKMATGAYVTFVDADDWIDETMYANMMQLVRENELDAITCGICRYWSKERVLKHFSGLEEGFYDADAMRDKVYPVMLWDRTHDVYGVDPSLCSKIIRKDIVLRYIEKALSFNFYLGDDTAVLYPTMLEAKRFYVLHECYYYHRQRKTGEIASYIKDSLFFEKLFDLYKYLRSEFEKSEYGNLLQSQLEFFYMRFVQLRKNYYCQTEDKPEIMFPFVAMEKGAKVVIYGAGKVGHKYMEQNEQNQFCEVVLWVDKNYRNFDKNLRISNPKEISRYEYDYVVLAVQAVTLADEIKQELIENGVPEKKIVWVATNTQRFLE